MANKVEKQNTFEINLVPDIKGEVLKKRKIQVWVIAGCLLVVGVCAVVITGLLSTIGIQGVQLGSIDTEIECRSKGGGKCSKYGVAVNQVDNVNALLTIKDQMDNLGALNGGKIRFSRLFGEFGILDALLMKDADENGVAPIKIHDLNANFGQTVDLNFSATAVDRVNNISYTTVERFKKNASEIYYDSGNYMRKDTSGEGGYVKIPSFCIVKEEVRDYGIIYGLYVKGIPGCEMPMVRAEEKGTEAESISKEERDRLRAQDIYSLNGLINPDTICDHTNGNGEKDVTCVWIRRTYIDNKDLSDYKNGDDTFAKNDVENEAKGMYYFESDCLSYDTSTEIGKFDEAATLEKCPLLSGIEVSEASQSTDENTGLTEASFSVTANVNRNIFLDTTKFTKVFGPSRRNVTDSYSQIRDMYTQKEEGN